MGSKAPDRINGYLDGSGNSRFAARADHTHEDSNGGDKYAAKEHKHTVEDITDLSERYAGINHDHGDIYADKNHGHAGLPVLVTISVEDWSGEMSVTKEVPGVTESGMFALIIDPRDESAAKAAGFAYSTRGEGSVTFTCTETPASPISMIVFV